MLIIIPKFVFGIYNSNFLFGQIWAEKVKVVRFAWKLAHIVDADSYCDISFVNFQP